MHNLKNIFSNNKAAKLTENDIRIMTDEEYEQCLKSAIYYIKRYEYDSIISKIERLVHSGRLDYKNEFVRILDDVKKFNYENALAGILKIKEMRI